MSLYTNIIAVLPFLIKIYCNTVGSSVDFDAQQELIGHFLNVKNLDSVILFTCWSLTDRMKNMKHLNEKNIAVTYRNGYSDAYGYFSNKDKSFELSLYSPSLGVIVDWSCNKDWMLFQIKNKAHIIVKQTHSMLNFFSKFTESWLWNASYHWLMMMETSSNKTIQSFLASKNINLTIDSEVLLAYPDETDKNMFSKRWHIFDVYRTAFKPRGKLVIDVLNETFGQWGNRLWKFDERLNLQNLTVNVAALINPVGRPATKNTEVNVTAPSSTEIVKYLQTFDLDRSNALEKFAFAIMYPLTKNILNMTMNIKSTNSWGYKIHNKWDGIVGMVESGEVDFSVCLNAIRLERLDVIDYAANSIWTIKPCFIYRNIRSSTNSINIFLQPFRKSVWFSLIAVVLLSTFVHYTIVHFESSQNRCMLKAFTDIFLLKICALCQQGTAVEPTKFSNRLIVFLMFVFSLIIYQFYSSSIVSSLLRHTVTLNIDSVKKLEESGFDVGVENLQFVTKAIEKHGEIDPYMKRIIDKKINPKSEYLVVKEGVQRIRKGHYAFFTDPSTSYWIIKNIFSEAEKCDLSEFAINKPEATAYLVPKKSPYKKLINYANDVLMETGLVERELRKWYGMKPKCVAGKTKTEESLVSVGIKDIASLLVFLSVGVIVSLTVLIMEIIVHQYHTEKTKTNERTVKIYIT